MRVPLRVALPVLLMLALLVVFVVPPPVAPRHSDLVVVLGGLDTPSRDDTWKKFSARYPGATAMAFVAELRYCPDPPPGATDLVCVRPDPPTTRGEAQMAAELARARGLDSMAVVTTPDQTLRAQLRFSRCWDGDLLMVQAPAPWQRVVGNVPYQVAAMAKALVVEPAC